MGLPAVGQPQALSALMRDQLFRVPAESAMVLGAAGGNGLEHVRPGDFRAVCGVDINGAYLAECERRHPALRGVFRPILADLAAGADLPHAELLIANLVIEYTGVAAFRSAVRSAAPAYVACALQREDRGAASPRAAAMQALEAVHRARGRADGGDAIGGVCPGAAGLRAAPGREAAAAAGALLRLEHSCGWAPSGKPDDARSASPGCVSAYGS